MAVLAIVKAWKADEAGNLVFRKTARNFNAPAATAGKITAAEVEEVVPTGSLNPDCIHVPGVSVQRVVCGAPYEKKIAFRTTREREDALRAGQGPEWLPARRGHCAKALM